MPQSVDHAERKAQIAEGLIRVAAREGLHGVTMRLVAAEAGVSLRLVQYYFQTKAKLMHDALEHLERQSHARWAERLARLPEPRSARDFIEAFFEEALPSDEPSRIFQLLWTSYAVMAMTDPELVEHRFLDGPNRLELQLVDVLRQAQGDGGLTPDLDVSSEAATLLALNHGLGTSVLVGQRSVEDALAVVHYHLDRLFDSG